MAAAPSSTSVQPNAEGSLLRMAFCTATTTSNTRTCASERDTPRWLAATGTTTVATVPAMTAATVGSLSSACEGIGQAGGPGDLGMVEMPGVLGLLGLKRSLMVPV